MFNLLNSLSPFFEDCYRRINVREYAGIIGVAPATAAKMLKELQKEGLLEKEKYKSYLLFHAKIESRDFIDLSRIYWRVRMKTLVSFMEKELTNPSIILFGSLSKAEAKQNSDVDLAVFSTKKEIDIKKFEAKIKRKIQLFWFDSIDSVKSKELRNNILNGYILRGRVI